MYTSYIKINYILIKIKLKIFEEYRGEYFVILWVKN